MKKGNLLIIDDEDLLTSSIKFLMSEFAEEIHTASDGAEGLSIFNKHQIHCVICDINMPVMTGVELLRIIRSQNSDVPFIFYTAYDHHELMIEAAKLGAFDFLKKPDFDCLQEVVSRGLAQGFTRPGCEDPEKLLSEYDKILKEISEAEGK